jgi:hypothetical protein
MDDMAIGDPVSLSAQLPLPSLFPRLHITQIVFQVIGNSCNSLFAMQYPSWPEQRYALLGPYIEVAEWLLNMTGRPEPLS